MCVPPISGDYDINSRQAKETFVEIYYTAIMHTIVIPLDEWDLIWGKKFSEKKSASNINSRQLARPVKKNNKIDTGSDSAELTRRKQEESYMIPLTYVETIRWLNDVVNSTSDPVG
jgi:hypothetical protein